ncbi:MAG TPA: Hsp20/alpha crystallin family protein [Thermoanaerobaculia bacterium]
MMETEQTAGIPAIDQSIGHLEQLYQTVTGREAPPPETPYAPIPAEKDPAQHVEKQLDRLLQLLGQTEFDRRPKPAWAPPVSVWESDTDVLVSVDLPGVTREQVEIVAHGRLLTITGERTAPGGQEFRLRTLESPIGAFRRAILLPSTSRVIEPKAEMRQGVLELRFPKEPGQDTTPRPIRVH